MGKVDYSRIYLWLFLRITTYNIRFHRVNIFQALQLGIMLTATENEEYWAMTADYSEETEDYYKVQYARLREKINVKNKYYPPGQEHYYGNFKYEDSTQWNEKLLTKMHSTIQLEGRPDGKPYTKATKGQSDSGSS